MQTDTARESVSCQRATNNFTNRLKWRHSKRFLKSPGQFSCPQCQGRCRIVVALHIHIHSAKANFTGGKRGQKAGARRWEFHQLLLFTAATAAGGLIKMQFLWLRK
ncbi:uncharacterized protein LOC122818980 [Drosophila biarmipes]|uniref:uncharacterized protein LOC122818980 n=1 Tax=Drosophila biarmipes TaxID=125945 RepID=UPI0021CCC912|nr:uncharacterized protein LOC122818980 [Drosophila biarmipes]